MKRFVKQVRHNGIRLSRMICCRCRTLRSATDLLQAVTDGIYSQLAEHASTHTLTAALQAVLLLQWYHLVTPLHQLP